MRGREPARIFVSYAEEDAAFFEAFQNHLAVPRQRGLVEVWHEGRITRGDDLAEQVGACIAAATMVVLLVSPAFVASERHWKVHVGLALEHHAQRPGGIVPIRIRPVSSEGAPFERFAGLPRDGEPIGNSGNDAAWERVVKELSSRFGTDVKANVPGLDRGARERSDDFAARVARLCYLRENRRPLVPCNAPPYFSGLWEVETSSDPIEVKPIAALDGTPTKQMVEAFDALLDARYRDDFPYLQSLLVHRGAPAPAELVREARRRGIRLTSFHALNQLIDFRGYVQQLGQKLRDDPVYPQDFYVVQRGQHVVGRNCLAVDNALNEIWDLVTDRKQPVFVLVLADFGTGKTFLLRQLATRLSEPNSPVVPVLVELRTLEKALSLDALLMQHFALAGERTVDLDRFFHMLEEGRIALLFDGFDELVPRVTFDRAAEHLETLIEAARGKAKVVITSRTQHFLSDKDVEQALARRADRVPHCQLFKLLPFNDVEIREFLVCRLRSSEAAERRFALLGQVTDLLGLSHNPRMLNFIADIEENKLLAARDRAGKITKAELYTLLVERWIGHEFQRAEYRGVPTMLDVPARWRAVLFLAERLWASGDKAIDLRELPTDLREELSRLGPADQDLHSKAHHLASGTLLVRDDEGRFSFLHRSILEFAAAWVAAGALREEKLDARLLTVAEMTDLMAEFFGQLVTLEKALPWAKSVLEGDGTASGKKNAQRVILSAPAEYRTAFLRARVVRREVSLRGESFAGQDLREADFSGSDLSEAVLANADLSGARLNGAKLTHADLRGANLRQADLRGADLRFARLDWVDLRGARLEGAVWRYARLLGAQAEPGVLDDALSSGACPALPTHASPTTHPGQDVLCVAVSPDGALLASGHAGGKLVFWGLQEGEPLRVWGGHYQDVQSVAFSPDGATLASVSSDKSLRLWRVSDGAIVRSFDAHAATVYGVAFSPDGSTLASGSRDNSICLWRVSDGALLRSLEAHSDAVVSVAFSPDGDILASGSRDNSIRLWRVSDGALLRSIDVHSAAVYSVAFSPDGAVLASGSGDKSILLWRVSDGTLLRSLQAHSDSVFDVAFNDDGSMLASGSRDSSIRLWRVSDGAPLRSLEGHLASVVSVAFTSAGTMLASGSLDNAIRLWRVSDGAPTRSLQARHAAVYSVAFSPDGTSLASSGSFDSAVRLWRVSAGAPLRSFEAHSDQVLSVAFSPDGSMLASGSRDRAIRLWRVSDGAPLQCLRAHSDLVFSVAFSPDGSILASGSRDNSIRLWRAPDGGPHRSLQGHSDSVLSVAFSPDGATLASGSGDNSVRLWRISDGVVLRCLEAHSETVVSVAFSLDGTMLASGSLDNSIRLWRVADGAPLRSLQDHSAAVMTVAFSPEGTILASGSRDSTIRLWRISDGAPLRVLGAHADAVETIAFSPDGATLASGSKDNTIRLWRVSDGQCLAVLYATKTGWVAFTPDGRYKLGGNLQGSFWHVIGLCRFEPGELDDAIPGLRMRDDEPLLPPQQPR